MNYNNFIKAVDEKIATMSDAAELISALGETMESYGNICAKKIIIEKYKKVHSTKRAFKAEFEVLK